jgi:DNA-binding response OmpR family regulator
MARRLHHRRSEVSTQTTPLRRALVAEDDADMRELVAAALRTERFDVDEVEDGRAMCLVTIRADRYDLVVSDVRLPMVDGLTVIENLRRREPGVRVILMTAFPDDGVRARAGRVGALLMDKPFRIDELRAAARRLFQ